MKQAAQFRFVLISFLCSEKGEPAVVWLKIMTPCSTNLKWAADVELTLSWKLSLNQRTWLHSAVYLID